MPGKSQTLALLTERLMLISSLLFGFFLLLQARKRPVGLPLGIAGE